VTALRVPFPKGARTGRPVRRALWIVCVRACVVTVCSFRARASSCAPWQYKLFIDRADQEPQIIAKFGENPDSCKIKSRQPCNPRVHRDDQTRAREYRFNKKNVVMERANEPKKTQGEEKEGSGIGASRVGFILAQTRGSGYYP
jgi:hypothetical protein